MSGKDLERLLQLKDEKYRIKETEIKVDNARGPKEIATVTLEKNDDIQKISSSEEDFFLYVIHLHGIPHIEDDESDFVYVDDPNEFFDIQERIVDMFIGEKKTFILSDRSLDEKFQGLFERIKNYESEWILSEKDFLVFPTKLCEIFFHVGVLMIKDSVPKFDIFDKSRLKLTEVQKIVHRSQDQDIAVCFSAFILGPELHQEKKREHDSIIGLVTYDLKNNRTLSLNLNTLIQFQRNIKNVGQHGFWECVFDLFKRSTESGSFKSFLPLPLNVRDFTPLPWLCYVFLKDTQKDILMDSFSLKLPIFLVFGFPLILSNKPSYVFRPEKQAAFIMLGLQEENKISHHQVRFDVSKGEPKLHLDYVIYPEKGFPRKVVSHETIDYEDIWNFSKNLAIGFLAASAYDVNFDAMIIPERLSGIDEAFKKNPTSVYPLFIRSMAGYAYKLLREKPEIINVLKDIATGKRIINQEELLLELEKRGLISQGELTILGDILNARLQQQRTNK